ncbi:Epidermal growth factor receptor kinase substrate 8-like protein 2 [Portunus trituberculatus]|uniref:Epidermal growth factor receptor kinase substrate 8-like protein 2 n=1 Tax=Portunus trituberculatus TaxID=210409 RepID=A0A5B7D407_PORTR|nr:Epidermal growth factor receptor kinase substrate 8-like protein 2 [Portunus trituberculatus]
MVRQGGGESAREVERARQAYHHMMRAEMIRADSEVRGEARGPRSERSSVSHNDDVSSTSSEKYERDVAILNSCFDDIERFIARLQHTAAATRELERRRRSRKSKKKDIGDGLLSMRAKPPPEREFVDIFQKFKLSFNLLAKLKAHIHDPNAPELVHFLFTPLALIVDASRDSNYGPNLPGKYFPMGGLLNWLMILVIGLVFWPLKWQLKLREPERKISGVHSMKPRSMTPPSEYPQAGRSDISQESVDQSTFDKHQQRWLSDLKARGAKIVQVTYPRTANNDKELTVVRGEYLEVLDDSRKWWKAVNARGQAAHVPHTIVTPYTPDQDEVQRVAPQPWKERQGKKGIPKLDLSQTDPPYPKEALLTIKYSTLSCE